MAARPTTSLIIGKLQADWTPAANQDACAVARSPAAKQDAGAAALTTAAKQDAGAAAQPTAAKQDAVRLL